MTATEWFGRFLVRDAPLRYARLVYGLIVFAGSLRILFKGRVTEYLVTPEFHFHYFGFSWVPVLPYPGMHILMGLLSAAGLLLALGFRQKLNLTFIVFGYAWFFLADVTYYLNHSYLLLLIGGALILSPVTHPGRPGLISPYWIAFLRLPLATVYLYGALCKLQPDWLTGKPLSFWLSSSWIADIIPATALPVTGIAMSWAGMIFDFLIVPGLLNRRTAHISFFVLVGFHVMTALLFPVGLFPWIMIALAPVFLPDKNLYPISVYGDTHESSVFRGRRRSFAAGLAIVFSIFQILWPLRRFLYPGELFLHEQGFRFSWNIMVMQKNGNVTYRIVDPENKREHTEYPAKSLSPFQRLMLETQPDLILQYAHFLRDRFRSTTGRIPQVYANARVTINQGPPRVLIDPDADLAQISDGWQPYTFVDGRPVRK